LRITDLLRPEGVALNAGAKDQNAALDQLVQLQNNSGNLTDPKAYKTALLAREDQGSTAIGGGVAVPHAKSSAVSRPGLAALTLREGADWGSPDGQKARLLFAIAAPQEGGDDHLEILSRLMVLLMDEQFREKLLQARDKKTFLAVIDRAEREKYPENASPDLAKPAQNGPKQPSAPPKNGGKAGLDAPKLGETAPKSEGKAGENTPETGSNYHVVAVTACPTGIAHTYMAAEALEKAGRRLGISVKVETQGSGGAKNKLSPEEIAAAHGVIIAADKKVELGRFAGRLVGKGSSLPGKLALKVCPDILSRVRLPEHIIAVTGSNGKTSTVETSAAASSSPWPFWPMPGRWERTTLPTSASSLPWPPF